MLESTPFTIPSGFKLTAILHTPLLIKRIILLAKSELASAVNGIGSDTTMKLLVLIHGVESASRIAIGGRNATPFRAA
jgi:hypothetical protein